MGKIKENQEPIIAFNTWTYEKQVATHSSVPFRIPNNSVWLLSLLFLGDED
jgi:hypothetical protein